jgi:hypothetical protein
MDKDNERADERPEPADVPEIIYTMEKDFYKGVGGKLRLKAEGLFKKAKEKGISIDEISISLLKDSRVEFPGIGMINLPAYIVKVRGRDIKSGQVIVDGKHIDYLNIYHKYVADKIGAKKNAGRTEGKDNGEMSLSEWERFDIGRNVIEDKEFGIEKTITGACDRVIRKLMGENDWLYPDEARLLDEEFNRVQTRIAKNETTGRESTSSYKRATERQINYLKSRIKNMGLDPNNEYVISEIIRHSGFDTEDLSELSTVDMSRIIDSVGEIAPLIKQSIR